ncbi:unnamed protein product [Microthlaspi erraticum]|uniref:RING-type domain-containing protein n=1 Tax=Microthlaspi erraticum TaxID=1685480 RepID=A0A6D2JY19_9BRAS|nr:unnamed protein product [Microthlaspi erraticum]
MDGGDRLRVTLLDRMSTVENSRSSLTGLTLEAILMADKNVTSPQPQQIAPPPTSRNNQSNRTLLDVMQTEHRPRDKTAWKSLREKLRLKRNGTVWISSNPVPSSDTPILNRDNDRNRLGFLFSSSGDARGDSPPVSEFNGATAEGRIRLGAVLAEERALSAREEETLSVTAEIQPARMSLMELLEENEGQMSFVSVVDGEEDDRGGGVAAEEEMTTAAVAAEISCCVCMVRSKGAAFIPCGHTFCRLCSRELWVQRGNCPLCNTTILEILDLF